ncbi:hypothetical protein PAA26_01115 [Methanomassiliicoccaceae archaeon COG_1]|nr:hypothetical protein [Methanomassiliicoccaceae archaeon COG_1]
MASKGMKMHNIRSTQTSFSWWSAMVSDVVNTPISDSAKTKIKIARTAVTTKESLPAYSIPSFIFPTSRCPRAAEHTGIIAAPSASAGTIASMG